MFAQKNKYLYKFSLPLCSMFMVLVVVVMVVVTAVVVAIVVHQGSKYK